MPARGRPVIPHRATLSRTACGVGAIGQARCPRRAVRLAARRNCRWRGWVWGGPAPARKRRLCCGETAWLLPPGPPFAALQLVALVREDLVVAGAAIHGLALPVRGIDCVVAVTPRIAVPV